MATPRRSSRQSTPTRETFSPPPTTRSARKSGVSASASTPSIASLAAPTSSIRKSTSTRAISPRPGSARPALPVHARNLVMEKHDGRLHKVKTQTLFLGDGPAEQHTITIARVKCPVPKDVPGHIIKRFDTNAVSASSLFRAAYPTATEAEESKEMEYIATKSKGKYGNTREAGLEWDEAKKLSGTWIPVAYASDLAVEYGIERYAADLIKYVDPDVKPTSKAVAKAAPESPARARSPRAKRARTAVSPPPSAAVAPSSPGGPVSIHQKLETTKVDIKIESAPAGLALTEEQIAAELAAAKALVDQVKADTGATGGVTVSIKRSLEAEKEEEEDEAPLPTSGTLADLPVEKVEEKRGFLGKLFRRANKRIPAPVREAAAVAEEVIEEPGEVEAMLVEQTEEPGRRWLAGFGLAVAVGATAAAPYLFG